MNITNLPRKEAPTLYNNRFPDTTEIQTVDYCDIHDLLAVVLSQTQNVAVFRINGQLAFQIARKDHDCAVRVLKWKPDGSLLGIGWSDGMVGVYSGEDGKLMSQTTVRRDEARDEWKLDLVPDDDGLGDDEEPSPPACIGWTTYSTNAQKTVNGTNGHLGEVTTEDWYDDEAEGDSKSANGVGGDAASLARLTKTIATLDCTTLLPRLSALPVHALRLGAHEQKFTTQAGVDTLFDATGTAVDDMTTFVTSSISGHTNVYLGDSVSLGHFPVGDQKSCSLLASHPRCSSQVILSCSADGQPFHLNYIELPHRKFNGSLLHVVTTQTTRIQNLLAYITQILRCMQSDLTSNLQLPTRIIANISEELSNHGEEDLITNLYHLAMTGTFAPPILEWLTETILDNTQKRWDKAVNDMYNHIQNHIFMNLVPTLDRLAIATDTIRGHARAHESTDTFVPAEPFTHLMDDIDSLRLTAQSLQLLIMTEHRQFRAFNKWLRVMMEVASAGPGSKAATETEEREAANIDYSLVLAYIRDTLTSSKLASYLEQKPDMKGIVTQLQFWTHRSIASSTHKEVTAAIQRSQVHDLNDQETSADLLNLPTLTIRLKAQARLAVTSITKWQSEMLSQPQIIPVNPAELPPHSQILDVKLYPALDHEAHGDGTTYVLYTPTHSSGEDTQIYLLHITRPPTRSRTETSGEEISLPAGRLLHASILNQDYCIALLKPVEGPNYILLSRNLQTNHEQGPNRVQILRAFTEDNGFEPAHFVVGGRRGKMVCVLFAKDGRRWEVLDLDQAGKANSSHVMDYDADMGLGSR